MKTKVPILFIYIIFIYSCGTEKYDLKINYEKSIKLIELVDNYGISEVFVDREKNLIINGKVIVDSIEVKNEIKPGEYNKVSKIDLINELKITSEKIDSIQILMNESNNIKLNIENGAYFFMTGSWIDAQWGKVYSERDLNNMENDFKFERIKDIKPIKNKLNWYNYYAD